VSNESVNLSRRQLLQASAMTGVGLALPGLAGAAKLDLACNNMACKPVPNTGETMPVIGVGTNRFGRTELATIKDVLSSMHELGGRVIDTAAMYTGSEEIIGQALTELGLHDEMFVATKFNAQGVGPRSELTAAESFDRSLGWLQADSVDLIFAHFVDSVASTMPLMQELKEQGRTRYIGITTVNRDQHPQIMELMREYPIDFLQIDYSLGNRDTATDVLPLAAELGIAVMVAVPFGGRRNSLFADIGGRDVPDWAADFGATTWGQFFLKYVVSHPAVTCAIPGTTDVGHMEDNQGAGVGGLPDEAARHRMEQFWDGSL